MSAIASALVDTDVFVDHLRGIRRLDLPAGRALVSAITRAELFAGPEEQRDAVRTLLSPFEHVPVDSPVAELAGGIRRAAGILLPDALIAASALREDAAVLTRNRRDFERVEGLVVRSPA